MTATVTICPPEHPHGSNTGCYCHHRCRCAPCVEAKSARGKTVRRQKAYGTYQSPYVAVAPALEHIQTLLASGLGCRAIARLSGTTEGRIFRIAYGDTKTNPRLARPATIRREAAARILAVKPDLSLLGPNVMIPALGAQRRIEALMTLGWTRGYIANQVGMLRTNLSRYQTRPLITVRHHRDIADLYERLWDKDPIEAGLLASAVSAAKNYARARRWVPPLGWDDIDNDATPPVPERDNEIDAIAVELVLAGERVRLNVAERRVALRELHAQKWSDTRIADAIGLDPRSVIRIRQELGLPAFDQNELVDAA